MYTNTVFERGLSSGKTTVFMSFFITLKWCCGLLSNCYSFACLLTEYY